jgi:hypothetical protein
MALHYQIIVSTTVPLDKPAGTFWLHPTASALYVRMKNWVLLANGGAIGGYTPGTYDMYMAAQNTIPDTPQIGQLWRNTDINQLSVYLDDWYPITGGNP